MRHLAGWSSRRVLALWLAWVGLLLCLLALHLRQVRRQLQSQAPPATVLPEQHTDFVYSVALDTQTLLKTLLLLLGPPGIVTALWLYARQRGGTGPPS